MSESRFSSDVFPFFRAWLADPLSVGAFVPSGRALAKAITAEITPSSAPVIELGPGTGVFTQMLLERGVPQHRVALVESEPEFARRLGLRFPAMQILSMDAAALRRVELFDGDLAGAVVSGLPVLSMPARKVLAILDGAFRQLRQGGAFYQFTYGPRCPVSRTILDRLGLKAVRMGRAWANMPPATVYRITRRRPRLAAPV